MEKGVDVLLYVFNSHFKDDEPQLYNRRFAHLFMDLRKKFKAQKVPVKFFALDLN